MSIVDIAIYVAIYVTICRTMEVTAFGDDSAVRILNQNMDEFNIIEKYCFLHTNRYEYIRFFIHRMIMFLI